MNVVDKERQVENDSAIHCTVCTVEDQDKNNLVIQLRYRFADYIRVLKLNSFFPIKKNQIAIHDIVNEKIYVLK